MKLERLVFGACMVLGLLFAFEAVKPEPAKASTMRSDDPVPTCSLPPPICPARSADAK